MSEAQAISEEQAITLTDRAARRIVDVAADHDARLLRVSVAGGGCQGFSYNFDFDNHVGAQDRVFENGAARVVIDDTSLGLLAGATIDFVDDLMGQYFKIDNPNAASSCGCSTSFSV